MKKIFALLAVAALPAVTSAETWTGLTNTWTVDSATVGLGTNVRGVTFDSNGNVIASTPSGSLAVLNATTGALVNNVANAGTGDGTIALFRVAATDDGVVFTSGFAGSVKRIANSALTDATGANAFQAGASGSSRAMDAAGSEAAGTAVIAIDRGGIVFVYTNGTPASTTYTLATQFTTGYGIESNGIWIAPDASVIYTCRQAFAGATNDVKRFTGTPAGGYTADGTFTTPTNVEVRYDVAFDVSSGTLVGASAHGAASGNPAGITLAMADASGPIAGGNGDTTPVSSFTTAQYYNIVTATATNAVGGVDVDQANNKVAQVGTDRIALWTAATSASVSDWTMF